MKKEIKQFSVKVKNIKKIKKDVYLLVFSSPYLAKKAKPGNFLHLKVNSVILRRPFSIHRIDKNDVSILFKVKGSGTTSLANYKEGNSLNIIGPLGNGFSHVSVKGQHIFIAGGIGVAPFMFLAQKLKKAKKIVLLGAKTGKDLLCEKEFKALKCKVSVATEDASKGKKGTAIKLLKDTLATIDHRLPINLYVCGPKEMFLGVYKTIRKFSNIKCQVSFEQFMGCGLGICCACTIDTKQGYKKVCKDGPVFNLSDIF